MNKKKDLTKKNISTVPKTHINTNWGGIPATNFPTYTRWYNFMIIAAKIPILVQYKL